MFSCYSVCCVVWPLLFPAKQAILTAVWDRAGADLGAWGCLLDFGSFDEVMSSELHRSAWVSEHAKKSVSCNRCGCCVGVALDVGNNHYRLSDSGYAHMQKLGGSSFLTSLQYLRKDHHRHSHHP